MPDHKPVFVNDIVTPKGRLSFPHLEKPDSTGRYADGKYKVTLLIPKTANLSGLKEAVAKCAAEGWPRQKLKLKDIMHPFRAGDEKAESNPAYKDTIFITCKTKNRPTIVDSQRRGIEAAEAYAGCDARLVVTAMSYEQKGKPGVTFLLDIVQKLGDNTRFGGHTDVSILDDGTTPEADEDDGEIGTTGGARRPAASASDGDDDDLFDGRNGGGAASSSDDDDIDALLG